MSRTFNEEITECGLKYLGHYNRSCVNVCGNCFSLEIPMDRIRDFTELFPDVNWENGEFLHKLIGRYIRVTVDDYEKLYSLHHITKPINYMINKECDEN